MHSQKLDPKNLEGLSMRNIGPAGMSGRVTSIDVVNSNPEIIYVGAASGGVWRSEDGGVTWNPIFDEVPVQSIGAIKINQKNPSEIWVGTGEGNPRNSHNSGAGVYKSIDGGKTWKLMGLEKTKTIHRIVIDHHNPDIVYVGAMGSIWGPNEERGVFKTSDGGKSWNKILYSNNQTGVGDMVMDPFNPRKLIVGLWEYGRTPWDFTSGGKGSGLHITYDGGENWKKITDKEGLPKGNLGRIGLAIARNKPNIIYALIEAKENGLYKSTDGGEKWVLVSKKNIGNRPFYYAELYVDPKNENRLWNLWSYVSKSEDGGKSFKTILDYGKGVHPDHHAFWIHPEDSDYMIDGNDGGVNISRDGGVNWRFIENLPIGQFYHVAVDTDFPYNVYGGMQDNGSWVGPGYTLKSGDIRNNDWRELYFGDGFDVLPRRDNNRYGWAMSQGGNIAYYDKETGYNPSVKPVHPDGAVLRYNWNAPLAQNPFKDCGIYYGSQFIHKSDDCGQNWTIISPDLTTNDTSKQHQDKSGGLTIDATQAENHTTILSIAPSAHNDQVIWVGTDDGNLQLTRDGGKTWNNLIYKLPGAPKGAWIPQIEVSPHKAGEVFVIINNYRKNDFAPYAYHTKDYGQTWQRIAGSDQISSFTLSIVQDIVDPQLLFLGTDQGMYVSINYGKAWTRWPHKSFPPVPVRDMKIQETEHDLVLGTFGRAFWVLDDLRPLRKLAAEGNVMFEKDFKAFEPPVAYQTAIRSVDGVRFTADASFKGDNKFKGPAMMVWIKEKDEKKKADSVIEVEDKSKKKKSKRELESDDDKKTENEDEKDKKKADPEKIKVTILSMDGDTLRRYSRKVKPGGFNKITWDMRVKGIRFPSKSEPKKDADDPGGVYVMPGKYKAVFNYLEFKDSTFVEVKMDPRLNITPSDLKLKNDALKEYEEITKSATDGFLKLVKVKKSLDLIGKVFVHAPDSTQKMVKDSIKVVQKNIAKVEQMFMLPTDVKGIQDGSKTILNAMYQARGYLNDSPGKPNSNAMNSMMTAKSKIDKGVESINSFLGKDWVDFQSFIKGLEYSLFPDLD